VNEEALAHWGLLRKKKKVLFKCNPNVIVIYIAPFFEGLSFSIRAALDFFRGVGR